MALLTKLNVFNSSLFLKTGLWEKIIMAFNSGIKNYALAIIVLTLVIKIIMFPLDFFNKKVARKNQKMQAIIQPEIEIMKKKYGNDKNVMNQKTLEIYKKHNYSVGGSCLFMIINLALTLTIFITLFAGLNTMAATKITEQYSSLQNAYYLNEEDKETKTTYEGAEEEAAKQAVLQKYNETKYSFLWIENVWMPDSPFGSPIPTYEQYGNIAKLTDEQKADATAQTEYEKIMNPLKDSIGRVNGYFILTLLVAGLMVVQQLVQNKKYHFKKKNILDNDTEVKTPTNKVMLIVMPIVFAFFVIRYNSVFALYLVTSIIFGCVTTPLINLLCDKIEAKEEQKKKEANAVSYRRK